MSGKMKKKTITTKKSAFEEPSPLLVSEANVEPFGQKTPVVPFSLLSYKQEQFQVVLNKSPFTQAQWAELLFLSERTLQRYAKSNAVFSGLHVERILQLEKLIDFANRYFEDEFGNWLFSYPFSLNGKRPFDYLFTYEGIKQVHLLIGRMQHGISA